jgi:hypothetical protein
MWAHYADSHRGACLQFRAARREDHIKFIGSAQRVVYRERMPVINVIREGMLEAAKKIFLTKPLYFQYENEWRIMDRRGGPGSRPLPAGIIGAVILGCRTDVADSDRIVAACRDCRGHVEVWQAEPDPVMFGLKLRRIAAA